MQALYWLSVCVHGAKDIMKSVSEKYARQRAIRGTGLESNVFSVAVYAE